MILYNVTVTIDPQIEAEWVEWMKNVHIPEVMNTGCFEEHKFLRLVTERPDVDGNTYAIQYFATDGKQIDIYMEKHAPGLRQSHAEKYGNKMAAFRTLLEEV